MAADVTTLNTELTAANTQLTAAVNSVQSILGTATTIAEATAALRALRGSLQGEVARVARMVTAANA